MKNLLLFVFALYLCQQATAFCCFRDPWMLPTTPSTNMCGCSNVCTNVGTSCDCANPCRCFKDPDNVCNVCQCTLPCECTANCGCGNQYPIYFPEVQYPVSIMEIEPFYFNTCNCGCGC
ncbi:uncharacterized protein LOC124641711 [Helicoverpa zea]|uniref:uncharacterized protein LOC124641711 n=1 Tax=Helicoverpa zea TaxID=7113 RepID=UPI001F56AB52|nr:uncharacterized protein LOC124641711 [Helicoverpa zea]